jgi:hypothetical protein
MVPANGSPQGSPFGGATVHHLLRSVLALLCGVLLFTALVSAFGRLAGIEAPVRPGGEKPVEAAACLAVAMLLTGYAVARIAGRWGLFMGAGVGVLMAVGAGRASLSWQGIEGPAAQMASLLLLPPFALLGAWAASRMARKDADKRAAETLPLPLAIRQRSVFIWPACLLSLGMAAAGVWVLRIGGPVRVGLSAALFFGGAGLVLAWRGIRNRPHAIFRDEGVELPLFGSVIIPWDEILDAAPHPLHPVAYVRLRVVDPQRYLARLSTLQTALTQAGEMEPNIGIPLTGTPYSVEQICALVRSRARASEERALAR